jgi:putative Holliday junction resolvase
MASPGRVLGIDYGEKRIGLALSDPLGLTAQPLETLPNREGKTVAALVEMARQREVTRFVIGLPRHMSGDEGVKAAEARAFGERLAAASGLPVEYADERLTTLAVQRMLSETDMSGAKKRAVTDKLAAALILQTWMDRERRKGA